MKPITINIPKVVNRVKIIHAEDIISEYNNGNFSILHSIDSDSFDNDKQVSKEYNNADIDDELLDSFFEEFDRNQNKGKKDALKEEHDGKKLQSTYFTEKFKISNIDKPIQIDLRSVKQRNLFVEEIHSEIQKAYDKGFDYGQVVTSGNFEEDINRLQEWIRRFDSVIQDLRIQFSLELGKLEQSISELSIMIAENILEHEISLNSKLFIEQARKAISTLDNEIVLKIHLHPDNVKILKDVKSSLFSDPTKMQGIIISENESVDRGGCIIETNSGIIDARIKTQLEKLKQSLKETVLAEEANV